MDYVTASEETIIILSLKVNSTPRQCSSPVALKISWWERWRQRGRRARSQSQHSISLALANEGRPRPSWLARLILYNESTYSCQHSCWCHSYCTTPVTTTSSSLNYATNKTTFNFHGDLLYFVAYPTLEGSVAFPFTNKKVPFISYSFKRFGVGLLIPLIYDT